MRRARSRLPRAALATLAPIALAALAYASTTVCPGASPPKLDPAWHGDVGLLADDTFGIEGDLGARSDARSRYGGDDTLWIFDADFEDLVGDNEGWVSLDRSGVPGDTNYWHKDTVRIDGFAHLGDSTWWCGRYHPCWAQPRGYGNDWRCDLSREFPLSTWSGPGDAVTFEWDQRYAIERYYDYGYVDISTNGGASWTTLRSFTNGGFMSGGLPRGWDHPTDGHIVLTMSAYAGEDLALRFRFESDEAYSSEDEPDNPPQHSVEDGAWQLDNLTWRVNGSPVWNDDCESPGDNGWIHDDVPWMGQTGVAYRRVYNPDPLREGSWLPHRLGWWMAAVDSVTGRVVNGERALLLSPPIDIGATTRLVGEVTMWLDCMDDPEDYPYFDPGLSPDGVCWTRAGDYPERWNGGPYWARYLMDWSEYTGDRWFRAEWLMTGGRPPSPLDHWAGLMIDRLRVGVPVGGPPTVWDYSVWDRFHDWFAVAPALVDSASITITDDDGIASLLLIASNDGGDTWDDYAPLLVDPGEGAWIVPPPTDLIGPATEIRYYFESVDSTGVTRTLPWNAPDAYFEFSILPIIGSVAEPGLLLVDKHGRSIPGEDLSYRHTSEYYFREALDVLGYEYDVYDVQVPSGTLFSNGPDTSGMKYYDTQIWFAGDTNCRTVTPRDQVNLINWLSQASDGEERNLLLTGNDIGFDLMDVQDQETLGFYESWLASDYVQNGFGVHAEPPSLREALGGFDFMTHDDGICLLWDG